MASLDSAKGPSEIVRPFLPETTFPSPSSGLPPMTLPSSDRRLNQAIHWLATFCISSGDRFLDQSVPRKRNRYSFLFCVFIFFLWLMVHILFFQCYDE